MSRLLLALDQGTTSSRAVIFSQQGQQISVAQNPLESHYPQPGWVEQNPDDIWQTQHDAVLRALASAHLTAADIAAAGIANQRETTVVWERRTGRPIYNAIVWQDRRTASQCEQIVADGASEFIRDRTGLVPDPYFSATKIGWILDNVPGARLRAERGELAAGTCDSWLMWSATHGELHITDVTNASRTMLFNIHTLQWDDELLQYFNIPRQLLPRVSPCAHYFGTIPHDVFGARIALTGVAGDQHAALFGQACLQPGAVKNTYGTGSFLVMNSGRQPVNSTNKLLTTVAWKLEDEAVYALEGSVFIAGAAVQWLRDSLGLLKTADESEQIAATVPTTNGVVFVPAFTGLGAPWWDASARGAIVGLTRGATKAHIVRAALEAVCMQSCDVVRAMVADTGCAVPTLRVDGGMAVNNLLMQMQADLLGVAVERPIVTETTALGAALIAGIGAGIVNSPDEAAIAWRLDRRFEPSISSSERDDRCAAWYAAVMRVTERR